jgi:hypothetical protein
MVGTYRTFHAFLDTDDPLRIISGDDTDPVLESRPEVRAATHDKAAPDNPSA